MSTQNICEIYHNVICSFLFKKKVIKNYTKNFLDNNFLYFSNEKALNVNTKTVIVDDKIQKRQCRLCGSLAKNCVQFLNEKSNEFLEKVTFHLNVEVILKNINL